MFPQHGATHGSKALCKRRKACAKNEQSEVSPKKNECIPHRCCARDAENRTPTFKKKKKPATRNGKTQTSKRGFTDKQTVFSDEHTGKRRKREGWRIYRKAHCDFVPTAALLFTPYIYNTAHSRFSALQPTLFHPSSSVAFHTFIRLRTSICLLLHRYTPFRPSSPLTKKRNRRTSAREVRRLFGRVEKKEDRPPPLRPRERSKIELRLQPWAQRSRRCGRVRHA